MSNEQVVCVYVLSTFELEQFDYQTFQEMFLTFQKMFQKCFMVSIEWDSFWDNAFVFNPNNSRSEILE